MQWLVSISISSLGIGILFIVFVYGFWDCKSVLGFGVKAYFGEATKMGKTNGD